jgi:hypothetical protein
MLAEQHLRLPSETLPRAGIADADRAFNADAATARGYGRWSRPYVSASACAAGGGGALVALILLLYLVALWVSSGTEGMASEAAAGVAALAGLMERPLGGGSIGTQGSIVARPRTIEPR